MTAQEAQLIQFVINWAKDIWSTTWPLLVPMISLAVILSCLAFQKANYEAM